MSVRPYVISAPAQPQYMLVGARPPLSQPLDQSSSKWNLDQSSMDISDTKSSSTKSTVTMVLVGVLVGVIVCGVPLAVMTTLYVQEKSQSSSANGTNSNSGSSGSTSTINLPSQCSTYTINVDSTRNIGTSGCCNCDSSLSAGWYRFLSPAGTQLTTIPVSTGYCGASYTGWFNGTHPSTVGGTSSGTVCVNYNGNLCYSLYSVSGILVTNCDTFYVYYLRPMSYCNLRYCTS